MELCKESLRSFSAKRRNEDGSYNLEEREIRSIMRDVCLGLQELHNRGIVHMDINPENILESFSGKFKIGDLGMSRLLTSIAEDHEIPEGDCRYMAKEVLIDDPNVPIPDLTKADVFAMGIVLFEMVEGVTIQKNGP